MSDKKQPIDPIDGMCRIALLNFKEINTKIGIGYHAVNIQNNGYLQGIMRYYYRDSKEDIFELFFLVTHLIAWFLVPNPKGTPFNPQFLADLKKMIRYMCLGLKQLQNTYKIGNVVLTLQYYINLLEEGLDGSFNIDKLPKCLMEDLWIESPLKEKITTLWDYDRLHRISSVFDDCNAENDKNSKFKDELINGYLLSIEKTLITYENEFNLNIKSWNY